MNYLTNSQWRRIQYFRYLQVFLNRRRTQAVLYLVIAWSSFPKGIFGQTSGERSSPYASLQSHLASGWNTWNTNSVLSHVHLPDGLAIDLAVKDSVSGGRLEQALIGSEGADIQLLAHSYDGAYTELTLHWRGVAIRVRSATEGPDDVIEITSAGPMSPGNLLYIQPHILWGKAGVVKPGFYAYIRGRRTAIYTSGDDGVDADIKHDDLRDVKRLGATITISTGVNRGAAAIAQLLNQKKNDLERSKKSYGLSRDIYDAMQTVLAWNVIYDPENGRVITPVSRYWSRDRGGYVLFCWDNYFASYMFSAGDRELAYANVIETSLIIDRIGFVPNHNGGNDISIDRSQPPIGSMVVKRLYDKYHEKWLLEFLFDRLLRWNQWWPSHRQNGKYLSWGTSPYPGMDSSIYKASSMQKAMWESGLDNSPMYDDVPFDSLHKNTMELADVGLLSLYIMDCNELADIAHILDRQVQERELRARSVRYGQALRSLWNEKEGMFLNRRTDNGEWSYRVSPTNFYPLLARVPSPAQAKRMITGHFDNRNEFGGEFIIPSIARNDPAYKDNNYWRGRIWAPMNFLVYMGLRNYDLPAARKELVDKSVTLLMKGWLGKRHIYENYNANTGVGDDVSNSDHFYHWGALLGFMQLLETAPPAATNPD